MAQPLVPTRIDVDFAPLRPGGESSVTTTPFDGSAGAHPVGPFEVHVAAAEPAGRLGDGVVTGWSLANRGDAPVRVRSAAMVFSLGDGSGPPRLLRHGYQSWSPSGVATLGVDADPSTTANFEFMQGAYHADQRTVRPGELRSEWVTVVTGGGGSGCVLVGFDGGDRHDGVLRLREAAADGSAGAELAAEAFLGDVVLAPGEERRLHALVLDAGPASAAVKLDGWAQLAGDLGHARTGAGYQVGWCSWYQYFHGVTEDHVRQNLAGAGSWPFEVFQIDDGYQAAIGDWLRTNDKFPSSLDQLAGVLASEGLRPGIWLAPFLVAPDSDVARQHPDWLVRYLLAGRDHGPLRAWWNPEWGGGDDGFMHALDTTNPAVLDHLSSVAAALVDAGFTYLKLDFTFAPSIDGGYLDPALTPAQRVRAGFDAVRRGAGDAAFLLGCGVPLANVVGVVDGARIGQDVAPVWALEPGDETVPGYLAVEPATSHAHASTLARSFMHRKLWLNDPDCLMLRTARTSLSPEAAATWAATVGVSGGMALVSDDLALLGDRERALLDDVIDVGRASDAAARAGRGPFCPDLLVNDPPTELVCGDRTVAVDPRTGARRTSAGDAAR
jgi:alpha-galactosidase